MQRSHTGPGRGPVQPAAPLPVLLAFPEPSARVLTEAALPESSALSPAFVEATKRQAHQVGSGRSQAEAAVRGCGGTRLNRIWCPAGVDVPRGEGAVLLNVDRDQL